MPLIRSLPKKPLIEAIFELRWQIASEEGDPHYSLFVGRLYDRVQSEYPFHDSLPSAMIPIPAAEKIIQHRFRLDKGKWPLVQVGPGIVTINDTDNYTWSDFGKRTKSFVRKVYEAYPQPTELKVEDLVLRYLDSFELDQENEDMFKFLAEKLKCKISFPSQLFQDVPVLEKPIGVNLTSAFIVEEPKGTITVRFGSGKKRDKPALIMETAVRSDKDDLPAMPEGFDEWIEAAHRLTNNWFFKFIEGELERRFAGE